MKSDTASEAVARAICCPGGDCINEKRNRLKPGVPPLPCDSIEHREQAAAAISAFTAWLQENGWQITRKEPDEAMRRAGGAVEVPYDMIMSPVGNYYAAEIYRAMLSAAPKLESDR